MENALELFLCHHTIKSNIIAPIKYDLGPFYSHDLTLMPASISHYTHYKVWNEITYPFLHFNGFTVEVQ